LVPTAAKPPAKAATVAKHAPVAPHSTYVLEIIQGTQKTVHKFDEGKKETGTQQ
jgi:hypothetical protein